MLKCGDYTLDRQIGWGRAATYYTAFAGDEAGEHRLVVRYSRYTDRPHVLAFLQSAAEQQTATTSGCRRVAPVLDYGVADNGHAYRVNLGYEVSLAECIQAGNGIDHDRLRVIVTGILKALEELRDKFKRPHGNLTAGNILIDQNGEVILTDLAPPSQDHRYFPDLHAIGEIIYQLVRQSLRVGFLSPPLDHSPEWSKSLGDHADDWREFTNRMLLTKRGEGQEGLKRAVADLKALNKLADQAAAIPGGPSSSSHSQPSGHGTQFVRSTPKRKSRVGFVVATLVVVAGASAGALFYLRKGEEEKKVDVTVPAPPTPREIVEKIPDSTAYPGADNYLRRIKASSRTYSDIQQYLYDWTVPGKLGDLAKVWTAPGRDWEQLADALQTDAYDEVVGSQSQAPEPEVLLKAAADVSRMSQTLNDAEALEKTWGRIEKLAAASPKITGLPDFKTWATWKIQTSSDVKSAGQNAVAVEASLTSFNKVARDNESRIHPDSWRDAIASLKDYKEANLADQWPQLWEKAITASLKADEGLMQRWTTELQGARDQIKNRPADTRPGLVAKVSEFEERVKQMRAGKGEEALTKDIENFRKSIRHPLEDMDVQYRAMFALFEQRLSVSAATADAAAALKVFTDEVKALRTKAEFRSFDPAFIAQHDVDGLIARLNAAIAKPIEPQFGFTSPRWVRADVSDTKATYRWDGRPVTFHILKGLNVAIASMETPLVMAKSAGVALDRPGQNGPLAFRDDRTDASRWLWLRAEQWYNAAVRRKAAAGAEELADPSTLLSAPSPDECPVTWISAGTARSLAQALGGRLPTRAEWQAALNNFRPTAGRLRGPAAAQVDREIAKYRVVRSPVTPFFPVAPTLNYGGTPPFGVTAVDEGTIWLRQSKDYADRIGDLIGNAAEWVADNEGSFIVGGSFATPPNMNFTTPVRSEEGNCDVSFRLAVPVTEGEKNAGLLAVKVTAAGESNRLRNKPPVRM